MSACIRVFDKGSKEYNALQAFADKVNEKNTDIQLRVETCYYDFSQNWMWTTLIAHDMTKDPSSVLASWQALSPKDQENIIYSNEKALEQLLEKLVSRRR